MLWLVLGLGMALGIYGTRPPAALGLAAPPVQFSAARAMSHLPHIASRPHPFGSVANAQVGAYLIAALRDLGLEVRVERTSRMVTRSGLVKAGGVDNIVATLRGTDNRRAVMLMAHFDSVAEGPGAADDGAGVSAILEVVRAVRAGPPLRNDLIILLTDGEEAGLVGAAGFAADHKDLASWVGVVVNLEARGSSGPALMFETSDRNGWLIPEFARAAPYPVASSLMYTVYKSLPNDTDLSQLKITGVAAFNFAFTETVQNYHSALDTPENLDPRSVQHMGVNTLGLTRHFGNLAQPIVKKPDSIYFNWLGSRLVFYPVWVGWILTATTFVLLLLAFVAGRRGGLLKWSFASLGVFFVLILSISAGMLAVWSAVRFLIGESFVPGDTVSNQLLFAGLTAFGALVGNWMMVTLSAKLGARDLTGGVVVVTAILAASVLFIRPGASYFLQWPALLGAGGLLLGLRTDEPGRKALYGLLVGLPVIVLLAPLAYFFFVSVELNAISLTATALLLSLLLGTAWPLFDFIYRPAPRMTMLCGATAVVLILAGAAFTHPHLRKKAPLTDDGHGTRKILPLSSSSSIEPRR